MKRTKQTIITVAILSLAACSRDKEPDTTSPAYKILQSESLVIPASIDLPANPGGNSRIVTYYAEGVQKYKSQPKPGTMPVTYEWAFVAPDARLFNSANLQVGTHTAGPSWQLSSADSIFAQHFAPARTAASPDVQSIDWLLLMPKTGKTPTGVFANVAYIQRIATKGGKAPTTLPQAAGEQINVPYTAIYRFTKKNP